MEKSELKFYTVKMLVEFDFSMHEYEDSEDPMTELNYRLDEGFQQFLKDYAHDFDPNTLEVVELKEQKKKRR